MLSSPEEIYLAALSTALIMLVLVAIVIAAIVKYQRRYRLHMEEVMAMKQTYNEELLKTKLEISEETLDKVSNEIHDNIGQMLALVKINLFTINVQDKVSTTKKIAKAKEVIVQVIQDVRNLSHTLSPEYLSNFKLVEWIAFEVDLVKSSSAMQVTFEQVGQQRIVDPQRKLIIIRIIQEGISNIIKHAKASNIKITIIFENELKIELVDDGMGFSQNQKHTGQGLSNMKLRSKIIGGEIEIQSENMDGTSIRLTVPYE